MTDKKHTKKGRQDRAIRLDSKTYQRLTVYCASRASRIGGTASLLINQALDQEGDR